MKKSLAFILASFVFASIFFKSIPAKASDYAIPNSGWLPVIYDIFYSLVNGNEINVAQLAGELSGINGVIEKYNEYRNTHFDTPIEGALSYINNSLFVYASSMSQEDLLDLAAQYSVYVKDGLHPIYGKYSKDRIARWNQYNPQFNDLYLDDFVSDQDVIEPILPTDYSYLSNINSLFIQGYNVFNSNFYQFYSNALLTPSIDINDVTVYSSADDSFSLRHESNNLSYYPVLFFNDSVITIHIAGTDSAALVTYPVLNPIDIFSLNSTRYNCGTGSNSGIYIRTASTNPASLTTTFNSLSDAVQYVFGRFSNINLYVNGNPWIISGDISVDDYITGPDVIRNDNDLIDSQDVFVPDQELAFDIIGLINLLSDKLDNLDTISFDDLITDGIILNPDGTALDDARSHILDMTIQRVIADENERDDPEPIPTTTPPPYPTFPEVDWRKNPIPEPLPTGFDTSNGNPADAFSGASTLAQIVDATNRGLPSELVYTFWGIVFGMIVLGIIKVLHK